MGSGGHNRKPTKQKILQGTFRKHREPENEPAPAPVNEIPRAPSHLNRWGKRKWKELAPLLQYDGLLTSIDFTSLELVCGAYGTWREMLEAIYHYTDEDGKRHRRTMAQYLVGRNSQTAPELAAMHKAEQLYKSLIAEFGLSPAARGRINVPKPAAEKDPMEALLNEA